MKKPSVSSSTFGICGSGGRGRVGVRRFDFGRILAVVLVTFAAFLSLLVADAASTVPREAGAAAREMMQQRRRGDEARDAGEDGRGAGGAGGGKEIQAAMANHADSVKEAAAAMIINRSLYGGEGGAGSDDVEGEHNEDGDGDGSVAREEMVDRAVEDQAAAGDNGEASSTFFSVGAAQSFSRRLNSLFWERWFSSKAQTKQDETGGENPNSIRSEERGVGRGGGKGSSSASYSVSGLSTTTATGGASSITALLRNEPPGIYCLRSSTKEIYEAYHCSGSFTVDVRRRGNIRSVVLDAYTNPCCKEATGQCQASNGGAFPYNPAFFVEGWMGRGRVGSRRLDNAMHDDSEPAHGGEEDDFIFVEDTTPTTEENMAADQRILKGSKGGGWSSRSRSSKGSKGSSQYYYGYNGYGGPPGPSPPGPPGPSPPSPYVGGQSNTRRGYMLVAREHSLPYPRPYFLPSDSPACRRKQVTCAGSSTNIVVRGGSIDAGSDSRDSVPRADMRKQDSEGGRNLLSNDDASHEVDFLTDSSIDEDRDRVLKRSEEIVVVRKEDYPEEWVVEDTSQRCSQIDAYRCAGDDANTPLRGENGGLLMKVVARARFGQQTQATSIVGQSESKGRRRVEASDSKGYAGGEGGAVTGQSTTNTGAKSKQRAQFAGYYYAKDLSGDVNIKRLSSDLCSKAATVYTCEGDSLESSYRNKSGKRLSKSSRGTPGDDLSACAQRLTRRGFSFGSLMNKRKRKAGDLSGRQGLVTTSIFNGMSMKKRTRGGRMAKYKVVALCEMGSDQVVTLSKYSVACSTSDGTSDTTNVGLDSPDLAPQLEPGEPLGPESVNPIKDGWPLGWYFPEGCPGVTDRPPMPSPTLPNVPNMLYKFNVNVPNVVSNNANNNVKLLPSCDGHDGDEMFLTLFKNPHEEGNCPEFSEKIRCPLGDDLDPFLQAMLDEGDYTLFVATDSPGMDFETCYNCYYAPVVPIDELPVLEEGTEISSDKMVEFVDGLPEGYDLDLCGDVASSTTTGGPRMPQRASATYGFNLEVSDADGGMEKVGIASACSDKEGKVYIDIFRNPDGNDNPQPMCEFSGAIECPDGVKLLETLLDTGNYFVAVTPEAGDVYNNDSPPWSFCLGCNTIQLMPPVPFVDDEGDGGIDLQDGIALSQGLNDALSDGLCDPDTLLEATTANANTNVKAFEVSIPPLTGTTLTFERRVRRP